MTEKELIANPAKLKSAEVEKIIVDLAKKGNSTAQIGLILRDQHGVPRAKDSVGKISKVAKKSNVKLVSEKELLEKNLEAIRKHIEKNKSEIGRASCRERV